ncbi:MAG: hypothetical protein Q9208_007288 [Pyrenodesmia sp. 3 TL-2023]
MASNPGSTYEYPHLSSTTKPDIHPSVKLSSTEDPRVATDLTSYLPASETPDQRPVALSFVQQQQNPNEGGVIGTLCKLPSADITSASTTVHRPPPVKQDQQIRLRHSPHSSPIATQRAHVPLDSLPASQQQPAAELRHLQPCDSATAILTTPHAQNSPQHAVKPNRNVQSDCAAARQVATSPSSGYTEQPREPVEAPETLSTPHPSHKSGSSDQQAAASQHQQLSPAATLCYQPRTDSLLVSPLGKRVRSELPSSDESWEDPLLCRPLEKRSRSISSPSYQPWEDPLLCSPPRTHHRTISTTLSSTSRGEQDFTNTAPGASSDRDIDTACDRSTSPASDSEQAKHDRGKVPTDPIWVRESLEAYNMFQDQDKAYSRYPVLGRKVEKILARKRQSGVTAEEYQEFKLTLNEYRDANEDTMVDNVFPFLIKESRKVPPNRAPKDVVVMESSDEGEESGVDSEDSGLQWQSDSMDELTKQDLSFLRKKANLAQDEVWVSVSFLRSGAVRIANREFWRAPVPSRSPDDLGLDKDLLKAMAKEDKLTNPKPDRVYGISRKFKWPAGFRVPSLVRIYLDIMRSCRHVYLINEAKSAGGDIREARNQACRGGTALVLSARQLWALLGEEDVVGADLRTIVFSAVMSPETVEIWVHWAEVPRKTQSGQTSQRPIYHMNMVRSESMNNKTGMEHLRACLHNIIDWGVGPRWDELQPLYALIIEYGRKQDQKKPQQGQSNKIQKSKGPRKW